MYRLAVTGSEQMQLSNLEVLMQARENVTALWWLSLFHSRAHFLFVSLFINVGHTRFNDPLLGFIFFNLAKNRHCRCLLSYLLCARHLLGASSHPLPHLPWAVASCGVTSGSQMSTILAFCSL